jgi:hypothetical protein
MRQCADYLPDTSILSGSSLDAFYERRSAMPLGRSFGFRAFAGGFDLLVFAPASKREASWCGFVASPYA